MCVCLISKISQQLVSELVLEKKGVWSKPRNKGSQNVFLYIPSCRWRRYTSTSETPVKNWRLSCPHALTRADVRTAHAHKRATRSFFARQPVTEPGWPATASASQEPQQQFRTSISHVIWPVSSCHIINNSIRLWRVIYGGPSCLRVWHVILATSSSWGLIRCAADTIHLTRGFIYIVH